jgi:adenylosuccinate synthase
MPDFGRAQGVLRVRQTACVPATVIVGAQWGDEGKGKIVDLLAQHSDVVCRYQGGPNAGHTIVADGETYKFRHMPSGILWGKKCVLGAGCVVDPQVFIEELDDLEARGLSTERVHLSGNAHLVMPWHLALDRASERRLGKLQIGTTRRGIGPAYGDKAARLGIRVQDLLDPKILREKIAVALAEKNHWLECVYGAEPIDLEDVSSRYESYAKRLRPYIADTSLLVDRELRAGKFVLFEGAQGTLLDLDHGTYPFVTSSNPVAGAAATGIGIGPNRIDAVLGVAKAYLTRVGEGPFPTEIAGPDQERVRELGGEYGTVTGRERRCGWLDLVGLRYAARLNGFTSLALTKLDVLSSFAELPICIRYRLRDGTETAEFPAHQSDFHHCEPVYEVLPGWEKPLEGMDDVSRLPQAARNYVGFIEAQLGVEVSLIGTGKAREHVLAQRELAAIARP